MPQGAFKKSSKTKQKQKTHQKSGNTRKGGRTIAPKKTKLVEAQKLQKAFNKSLKESLEGELSQKASHVESKSFKMVKLDTNKDKAGNEDKTQS